jgi:hypothetical protein
MTSPLAVVVQEPKKSTTKRSVFVTAMLPVRGKLTPLARKLHILLGKLSGEQFRLLDESEREEIDSRLREYVQGLRTGIRADKPPLLLQPRFTASLKDLAVLVGYDPKEARRLVEHLKLLQACHVEYNSLRSRAAEAERELYPDELQVTGGLLSSLVRTGRGEVSWSFDPVVLSIMVVPRTYAQLNLDVVRGVRSYAAVALYENCQRFVGTGRTGVYPSAFWRRLLSPTGQVPAWRDNERELMRTVKAAIRDLQACEACDIELEPVKVRLPNNTPGLQFKVRVTQQGRLPFGEPPPVDRDLRDRLLMLGFSQAEARHMQESRDPDYLRSKLDMLAKARNVKSPKGWLVASLEEDFHDEDAAAEKDARRREEEARRLNEAAKLREAFDAWRARRLREAFAELEEDIQAGWERRFSETATATQLSGRARQAAFFGWLAQQDHGLLRQAVEVDPLAFAALRPDQSAPDEGEEARGPEA